MFPIWLQPATTEHNAKSENIYSINEIVYFLQNINFQLGKLWVLAVAAAEVVPLYLEGTGPPSIHSTSFESHPGPPSLFSSSLPALSSHYNTHGMRFYVRVHQVLD